MTRYNYSQSLIAFAIFAVGLFVFVSVVIADVANTSVSVGNAAPTISVNFNGGNAITLNEATYAYATATLTITDANGCNSINYVKATAFLASTSAPASTICTGNDNNCYPTSSSTASYPALSDAVCLATTTGNQCTGGLDTSVVYDCGFKLWFIAEATDASAPSWASSIWAVAASTSDGLASTTASNTNQTVEINTLAALDLTGTLAYGSVSAGTNTGSTNSTTTATTTGNIAIDAQVYGNASYMESGANTLHIARQKYQATPFIYSSAGVHLTSTTTPNLEFASVKTLSTTSVETQLVSWGIAIESGQANGTYTGSSTLAAVAD